MENIDKTVVKSVEIRGILPQTVFFLQYYHYFCKTN